MQYKEFTTDDRAWELGKSKKKETTSYALAVGFIVGITSIGFYLIYYYSV